MSWHDLFVIWFSMIPVYAFLRLCEWGFRLWYRLLREGFESWDEYQDRLKSGTSET